MEKEEIEISITLDWSKLYNWKSFKIDMRYKKSRPFGVKVPELSGVYEVKYIASEDRLTIGKGSNLRHRIKQDLVKGKTSHSTGERIRVNEDVSKIVVRWATSNRPACVEEELHERHLIRFGRLPKYTLQT